MRRLEHLVSEVREIVDPTVFGDTDILHYSIPALDEAGGPLEEPASSIQSGKLLAFGGEVAISKLNPRKARVVEIEARDGLPILCSSEFIVLRPVHVDRRYLVYLLTSEQTRQELDGRVQSATRSHQRVRPEALMKLPMPAPAIEEQRRIADFLDAETARIDALIAKKRRMGALLEERRRSQLDALVYDVSALAGGGDGVAVVTERPVVQLRRVARFMYGESLPDAERDNGDVLVFGSNGAVGTHARSNTSGPVIVIGRKGSHGKVQWSNAPVFAIDTTYFVDQAASRHHLRWLYYALGAMGLDALSSDVGVPGLSRERAYAQPVPLPPLDEQRRIADFLDAETARVDALTEKLDRQIELLQERRQALITAAVTGQIPVPA